VSLSEDGTPETVAVASARIVGAALAVGTSAAEISSVAQKNVETRLFRTSIQINPLADSPSCLPGDSKKSAIHPTI
jgi:hypothetical protein